MSSWLGGLGSGLGQSLGQVGGSLSSFTGQISNFTKDILLEGAEEVGDATTELHVSNSKLMEVEAALTSQKSEYERLRRINAELEEKLEAAEIQVKRQSEEYRTVLQQKEVDISHLKARQNSLQEEVQKLRLSAHGASVSDSAVLPVTTVATTTSSSSFLSHPSSAHHGFHGDEVDLSDVLWSQQEINRLSSEVHRLEADVTHWRRVAQASKVPGAENGDQAEILKLQRTIKELREEMGREVDEHQHELAALQDAHRQKMADMAKRHRDELAEYEERIEELEEQIQTGSPTTLTPPASTQDASKVEEMQTMIHSLRKEAELHGAKARDLAASLEEAERRRAELEQAEKEAKAENAELLQNYGRLQSSVSELQARVQEQESKTMAKAQQDGEIQALRKALADAEKEVTRLKALTDNQGESAEVEHADILELNTIVETLRNEKEELEKEKVELVEKLKLTETRASSTESESVEDLKLEVESLQSQLEQREEALKQAHLSMDTLAAELEELDQQNQDATQHLITMKDQLAAQKSQEEAVVARLKSELKTSLGQKEALTQELEAQKEKLSQSAFTLNDLHMGKQQLEATVKELREKLKKSQELCKEGRAESSELKKLLQGKDADLSAVREELSRAGHRKDEVKGQMKALQDKDEEIQDLRKELMEVEASLEKTSSENFDLKIENRKLKEENFNALENVEHQLRDSQASLSDVVLEKDTRIEALKLEKDQLEGELSQAESRLMDQAKQYQRTIDDLTKARSMDASALQMEHERAVKLNQEKDLTIAELKREMKQIAADHKDTSEMLDITVAGQKQLADLIQEKDAIVASLKAQAEDTQKDLEARVSQERQESENLKKAVEEKDKQLGAMKEENSHLKEEIDRLRDQQSRPQMMSEPKTLDIITELETEVSQLRASRDRLQDEAGTLRASLEQQQESLSQAQHALQVQQSELEQARLRHEQSTLNYEKLIGAKDEDIARLQAEMEALSSQSEPQTVDILQEDKRRSLSGDNGNEKHDLSKVEIDRLVKGIKEKETEIVQLSEKNLSLTKQLDQLVVSRDELGKLSQMVLQKDLEIQALHARVSGGHVQDVLLLQQQMQAYAVEREQVLAVLNEKTRENSQLRSEYHRIMDIVASKEAALLKLQQENQRLTTMSDPSGSQEMFRETIQNLSRIIREKDIEIDALTQKCQTLIAVLQASGGESGGGGGGGSGGVSSNQFEELLQERDTLKQQVKKMDEWKQQVITTVKNMQHESAQLQEELLKLQGQVSADSDCSSKLSVDYTRLIQSYEQKEKKLGCLSQELAQVQQSISQLSSTKDVLLGKLGSVTQVPEASTQSLEVARQVTHTAPSPKATAPAVQDENLGTELELLRRTLAEKDRVIRTLQENNHRLSNSASLSESEQRVHGEELRQVQERLETLQRSLREKDLLIKAKGDQLNQVSESLRNRENDNEVLKQAVTNLKERALIFELDVKKLKEDNEAVTAKSREKETEFRALQETNMQVSLMLREREFQCSTMTEKAAAMEKLLKDRDQGKSGELNQLLNEVKSMQEKAVAFQQERDQVMLALKQKQMETSALQSELQHTRDKEQRQKLELERLRNHLLEIEESYTREALAAEDRETELRRRVALLDERLASSSSAVESASQQASLQVESLQEQLNVVVRQRDEAILQLHAAQEQVNQYAVSLSNLQMVLEQFQQEEKAMYSAELEKHKKEKQEWRKKAEVLEDKASALQINLDEANAALESASRLTDQLDLKEEQIEELKKQVEAKQEMLDEAQQKLTELLSSTEGKVDKVLMRNLFVGYFHTPKNKRSEVLRLMANVLGLDRGEVDQMLEEDGRKGVTGWVSGWLGGGRAVQSVPTTPQRPTYAQNLNGSFSEMFVKFLEVESSPTAPPPKLSMLDIKPLSAPPVGRNTATATTAGSFTSGKRTTDSNPFLAPRSAAVPLLTSGSAGPAGGHLLMKPISDALPTFTPVPVAADASGGAVLKDLLKQ